MTQYFSEMNVNPTSAKLKLINILCFQCKNSGNRRAQERGLVTQVGALKVLERCSSPYGRIRLG
ncbi:hypothetical protein MANES_10G089408v8 [Manihot esculenta]|uniref:Uncharacterized protein n=1 Tax=Manihot esculenta TaxID=3983 RepID=A0ACB7H1K9_MANES|nr:hypothetical protein MANES_10G089408v8 [Manihot esculenta]